MSFKIKHMKCKLEQGQTLMTGIFFVTKVGWIDWHLMIFKYFHRSPPMCLYVFIVRGKLVMYLFHPSYLPWPFGCSGEDQLRFSHIMSKKISSRQRCCQFLVRHLYLLVLFLWDLQFSDMQLVLTSWHVTVFSWLDLVGQRWSFQIQMFHTLEDQNQPRYFGAVETSNRNFSWSVWSG